MHTSQTGAVPSVLYVLFLAVCLRALFVRSSETRRSVRRPHPLAAVIGLVVAVPSLVQLVWPPIFEALSRQPDLIEQGQLWRLITSVTVQDSGIVGTLFNLVALALALPAAFVAWKPVPALMLFIVGALAFNIPATFVWHDAGGGSSAATFFLVTATAAAAFVRGPARIGLAVAVVVAVAAGAALLLLHDAHGEAVLAGVLVGAAVTAIRGRPELHPGNELHP